MENQEIIRIARSKAESWLNEAYDKDTRTEVKRLLNANDPTELIEPFTTISNSVPEAYGASWELEATE